MRWHLDATWTRATDAGRSVLGGSPLHLFTLSPAGATVADRVELGNADSSSLTERLTDAGAVHPVPDRPTSCSTHDLTIITPQFGGAIRADGRITVDDASDPPLAGAAVRLDHNVGPSGARNAGRRVAATSLLAFVDADVDLPTTGRCPVDDAGWWAPLLAHFDDPRVGLVAPRVGGDPGSSLDLGPAPARIRSNTRVSYVPAAMVIVRAEAFDDIGGFDETLRVGEDVDFVWRLDEAGWRCRYDPRRSVRHRPRESLSARLGQQVQYGSSSAPLAMRHPRALAPARADRWTGGAWSLAIAGHPVLGAAVATVGGVRVARRLPEIDPISMGRIVLVGQLSAGRHLTRAVRRAWWPLVLAGSLVSRRARRVVVLAVLADPRRLHLDLAFGWGLWRSMVRHREWRPIVPRLTSGR